MKSWQESMNEYARGIAGGLIFSLPLLYTMEMWWAGQSLPPYRLLAYLCVTFLLLLGYNRYAGLHDDASLMEIWTDSVEEMGLGLLLSFVVLQSIGQLHWGEASLEEISGRVIVQAMPVAIGISIGTAQLGTGDKKKRQKKNKNQELKSPDFSSRFILAVCGSVVIAGNIAPTDEINQIAVNSNPASLLIMIMESLILGIVILFFSDFQGSENKNRRPTFTAIISHSIQAYVAALLASVLMLWFFGQLNNGGLFSAVASSIVLGLPAMLGASAGRLLIKGEV